MEDLYVRKGDRWALERAKIVAMVTLGFSALACSLLPLAVTRYLSRGKGLGKKGRDRLGVFLRFGGGILLATTFVHLLPEVREGYESLQKESPSLASWPANLPELVMCAGFFMMYIIEEAAHRCLHGNHDDTHTHGELGGHVVEGAPPLRGLLIVVALSVHQVFEGLAVGLEQDVSHVWVLLGAVAAHKLVIAFCVGFEVASARIGFFAAAACIAIFAIASPVGIGIGIGLSWSGDSSLGIDSASVVLQGLATGTLLFVVFFEVLTKPEEGDPLAVVHCTAALIGFVLMTILLYCFTD